MPNYKQLIEALIPSVLEAGAAIMNIHASGVIAEEKQDGSPVTAADKAAEKILLAALKQAAPEIVIVSEENAESHALAAAEQFFLVDPLDGTKEFLKADGKGAFTVNIALIENNIPTMGVVYAPALGRLFWGANDVPAMEESNGKKTAITIRDIPADGRVAVASASHRDEATDKWLAEHGIDKTTSIGSSLKFCLVASGEADVYPRFGPTMEWDTAAGDAVLRAAGGTVRNPDDTAFLYGKSDYRNGPFVAWGQS